MKKIKVAVVCGGESVEHEISLASAKNVFSLIDTSKYEPFLIGITKKGKWWHLEENKIMDEFSKNKLFALDENPQVLQKKVDFNQLSALCDVAFPILHGTMGEDGAVQGFFKVLHIPFVGPSILDAAVGMDKEVMKRLVAADGIRVVPFMVLKDQSRADFDLCSELLGKTLFIKPSNCGSSVGISKVDNKEAFWEAVSKAFQCDSKILVEKAISCREIEVAVLGHLNPIASLPGEVIPHHEFYSYEAKYLDEKGASFALPAKLTIEQTKEVRDLALEVYKTGCCKGMARVDFFLSNDGQFYFNEINSIPGFTSISLYPKLFELSGLSAIKLVNCLLELALYPGLEETTLLVKEEEALFD